ncbi:hypothetical protein Acsp04_38510 [Actinomadura sp. NBRC 104425]|uniref:hypothetical protein n=1 Tax=Actinomadura sp. NBRC 104425 TaxID=3032204 RepID=UPI0024A37A30|nr:hypothetical protein [Actinomadura sp. NBRC 104425]GLZ13616.1 hypothetical protein Acsp04_38510 [Actinomadura sp. NBRC 104425]
MATAASPRLGFGIGPDGTYTRGGQVLAFVLGVWAMLAFLPLVFAGAVLYTRAEERFAEDPERARRLVTWSWLCVSVLPPAAAAIGAGVYLAFA